MSRPYSFSWDTVSTWALPGIDSFLDADAVQHYSKFDMLSLWGFNASCTNNATNVTHCHRQPCFCPHWRADQDAKARLQAAAMRAATGGRQPVFGYNRLTASQLWYPAEMAFNLPEHEALWLKDSAGRPVNCSSGASHGVYCNYEGPAAVAYDFSVPAARRYYLDQVVTWSLREPLSGLFVDMVDEFADRLGSAFGLSPTKLAQLTNGTFEVVSALLQLYEKHGKVAILSAQATPTHLPGFYSRFTELLQRHPAAGMRYYETFCPKPRGWEACAAQIESLRAEARRGIAVQAHYPMQHDEWPTHFHVGLAAFLVGAGEYHFFSSSIGWGVTGFPWASELYERKLGAPTGEATREDEGAVYERSFAHAHVHLDLRQWSANISARQVS